MFLIFSYVSEGGKGGGELVMSARCPVVVGWCCCCYLVGIGGAGGSGEVLGGGGGGKLMIVPQKGTIFPPNFNENL